MKYGYLKGSEKDFEGAPEWAYALVFAHSMHGHLKAFCGDGKYTYLAGFSGLETSGITKYGSLMEFLGAIIIAERRPITEPEWDGVGLPPIGRRVEYSCKQPDLGHPAIEAGKWYGGTIIAYHNECVWTSDNGIRHLSNTIFRPIRSDKFNKKYSAIEALFAILYAGTSASQDSIDIYDAIAAGKIPGVKLED